MSEVIFEYSSFCISGKLVSVVLVIIKSWGGNTRCVTVYGLLAAGLFFFPVGCEVFDTFLMTDSVH